MERITQNRQITPWSEPYFQCGPSIRVKQEQQCRMSPVKNKKT